MSKWWFYRLLNWFIIFGLGVISLGMIFQRPLYLIVSSCLMFIGMIKVDTIILRAEDKEAFMIEQAEWEQRDNK